jgi:hypothetical protein
VLFIFIEGLKNASTKKSVDVLNVEMPVAEMPVAKLPKVKT